MTENEKKTKWYDNDRALSAFMAVMITLIVGLLVFTVAFGMYRIFATAEDASNEISAIENCHEGVIVDKKISDGGYEITFQGEYEYGGETKTAERTITVDKSVYIAYNVGDEFDEQNLIVSSSDVSASDTDDDDGNNMWWLYFCFVWPVVVVFIFFGKN